jgi:salicylate hydroxylase
MPSFQSTTRNNIHGIDDPLPTGDSVYRAIIPTAEMVKDPILEPLVAVPELSFWMGPAKHIVGYYIVGLHLP